MKTVGYGFLISLFASHLFFTNGYAQRFDSSPLMNEIMYRYELSRMLKEKKKSATPSEKLESCLKVIEKSRQTWRASLKTQGEALQKEGFFDQEFSEEEMRQMPNAHPHLVSPLRGQNKLIKKTTFSHAPLMPHTRPDCEGQFVENVQVVDIKGKTCRQVKMSLKENQQIFYYQTFCAKDNSIYINYASQNETSFDPSIKDGPDCIHCP